MTGKSPMQIVGEYVRIIIVALILAGIIRTFIVQPYYIPSGSMMETLLVGDRVLVTKFSYGIHIPFIEDEVFSFAEPQRGDVIVFPFPENPKLDYIKRVIGVPGDTIEIRNKQLYRNGELVEEDYIQHTDPFVDATRRDNMPQVTVPEGKLFVMGDNRDDSMDSRFWQFVDKKKVWGKAQMIYWSSVNFQNIKWGRIGTLL